MIAPTVSVLMPLYNCEAYLEASLASLAAQSFADFEIIAVNDGSTDGSAEILNTFALHEPRCRVFHTENRGIVAALNTAAAEGRGRYFARLDGDDIARPDRFAEQVAFLDANKSCVCVGSLYRMIDETGTVFAEQKPFGEFRQTDLGDFPPHVASPPHPSIMMRRDAFEAIGGYRIAFPHAEDHDLFLRLARLGRIELLQKHLLDYRIHRSSLSSRNVERQSDSALCAVLSALCVDRGRPDPATFSVSPGLQEYLAALADPAFTRVLEDYRLLRFVHAEMNRRNTLAAWHRLGDLVPRLAKRLPLAIRDRRYRSLLKAVARTAVKNAIGKV